MADPEQDAGAVAAESAAGQAGAPVESPVPELGLVRDVTLRLTVEVGSTSMAVGDVMGLEAGSVIELDRNVGDPADLLVNGKLIGRAEVTVEDERLAIRVVELMNGESKGS